MQSMKIHEPSPLPTHRHKSRASILLDSQGISLTGLETFNIVDYSSLKLLHRQCEHGSPIGGRAKRRTTERGEEIEPYPLIE